MDERTYKVTLRVPASLYRRFKVAIALAGLGVEQAGLAALESKVAEMESGQQEVAA